MHRSIGPLSPIEIGTGRAGQCDSHVFVAHRQFGLGSLAHGHCLWRQTSFGAQHPRRSTAICGGLRSANGGCPKFAGGLGLHR